MDEQSILYSIRRHPVTAETKQQMWQTFVEQEGQEHWRCACGTKAAEGVSFCCAPL